MSNSEKRMSPIVNMSCKFNQFFLYLCIGFVKNHQNRTSMIVSSIKSFGRYCIFMAQVFRVPDKWSELGRNIIKEISKLGVDSIPLTMIISVFIGAVICIQMQLNIMSPLIPSYSVGLATREILLLEFSSSILCVNSANYIVLPKIVGFVLFVPVLVILSMFMGLIGGWGIAFFTGIISVEDYIFGIQTMFVEWYVWYGIIKTFFFAFIITSVAAFFGYYVRGGALEVGKASTNAVVVSSIMILFMDVILTKLLLQ